jgi:hypothetical protein
LTQVFIYDYSDTTKCDYNFTFKGGSVKYPKRKINRLRLMNETAKRGRGRPPKSKTGKHLWIPAEFIEMVQAMIQAGKQVQQAKQQ